jgi:hypothetical protein
MTTKRPKETGIMMSTRPCCIAYEDDGRVCRRPAAILDKERGGMVCEKHRPRAVTLSGNGSQSTPVTVSGKG